MSKRGTVVVLFVISLLLRLLLVNRLTHADVAVHAEWGRKFWEVGARTFYQERNWYYSKPTQPPITSLMFGGAGWLFEHKYYLALMHNKIKIPPAVFIEYFYENGYELLLKSPAIAADMLLGLVIYMVVNEITKDRNRSLGAMIFYWLNPVSILLSGGWGQTESVIALWGMLAFWAAYRRKTGLAMMLMAICLMTKPTWGAVLLIFVAVLVIRGLKAREAVGGLVVAGMMVMAVSYPFSGGNFIGFGKEIVRENILPSAKGTARASISAFNFQTIIFKIDRNLGSDKIILIPAKWVGIAAFLTMNIMGVSYLAKKKADLFPIMVTVFGVGFGSVLFLTNMLERYFFVGFPALTVVAFSVRRVWGWVLLVNVVLMLNLVWAFWHSNYDEIDHPFTNNNFLVIRLLSVGAVLSWGMVIRRCNENYKK